MGRKAAHKRNAAAAAAAGGAEKSGPAKKAEDGQEKQKGSTKAERGSKQKVLLNPLEIRRFSVRPVHPYRTAAARTMLDKAATSDDGS